MDEDEDKTDDFTGAPQDILSQLSVAYGNMSKSQEAQRQTRRQILQQGIEALKQRRYGPSLAEQMFALSGAFATPTRGGFGGVMSNVMPVLGQMAAARREGQMSREDKLLALQRQYALDESGADVDAAKNQIAALRVAAQMSKPAKQRTGFNPQTGRLYDMDTGQEIPLSSAPGGSAPSGGVPTKTIGGKTYYFYDGGWDDEPPAGMTGGPTGSTPSGGFRP